GRFREVRRAVGKTLRRDRLGRVVAALAGVAVEPPERRGVRLASAHGHAFSAHLSANSQGLRGLPPEKFSNRTGQGLSFRSAPSPGSGFSPQSIALRVAACWRRMVDRPKWSWRI